jgi:hypothetical protein
MIIIQCNVPSAPCTCIWQHQYLKLYFCQTRAFCYEQSPVWHLCCDILLNAHAEDMNIEPLINNLRCLSPLVLSDLYMTPQARMSFVSQAVVIITCILTKYVKGFETQQSHMALQHPA